MNLNIEFQGRIVMKFEISNSRELNMVLNLEFKEELNINFKYNRNRVWIYNSNRIEYEVRIEIGNRNSSTEFEYQRNWDLKIEFKSEIGIWIKKFK